MKDRKLTDREQEVLNYVLSYFERTGTSPSMREIGKGVYLSSVSSVHRYVHSLVEKGCLYAFTGKDGQFRAILPVREEKKNAV